MKNTIIGFVAALAMFATVARTADAATQVTHTASSSNGGFYLGFSTDSTIVAGAGTVPAISALFGLSDKLALQLYAGLSSSTPVNFGAGGMIKYTVVGDNSKGFHVGGGIGLGTSGVAPAAAEFYISFGGNLGFHFQPVDGVMIAVDGGVGVMVGTGATGTTTVRVGGNGTNLFGMSLLFRL